MAYRHAAHIEFVPRTRAGRVIAGVTLIALIALAFFFLAFALIVAGVLILAVIVRNLFSANSTGSRAPPDTIEGQCTVESEEPINALADETAHVSTRNDKTANPE